MTTNHNITMENNENIRGINDFDFNLICEYFSSALILAKHLGLGVTALDLFPQFIDILRKGAKESNVDHLIQGVVGSMEELPFAEASLDLIWCERAIYNIGFERGITEWSRLLKAGGYIAVTEPTWLTDKRPKKMKCFGTTLILRLKRCL